MYSSLFFSSQSYTEFIHHRSITNHGMKSSSCLTSFGRFTERFNEMAQVAKAKMN